MYKGTYYYTLCSKGDHHKTFLHHAAFYKPTWYGPLRSISSKVQVHCKPVSRWSCILSFGSLFWVLGLLSSSCHCIKANEAEQRNRCTVEDLLPLLRLVIGEERLEAACSTNNIESNEAIIMVSA